MTISKQEIKFVNSLKIKKYRYRHKKFVCEGKKNFEALLKSGYQIDNVYLTKSAYENFGNKINDLPYKIVSEEVFSKISSLKNPQGVLAIVNMPQQEFDISVIVKELTIFLDKIQDPGNMGTILRLAYWFGVKTVLCSVDTVDIYNPKTIQASMGAIFQTQVFYVNAKEVLSELKTQIPIYGTFADGENIYRGKFNIPAVVVFGNEGNGISPELYQFFDKKISVPSLSQGDLTDSLNVGVAAGIILSKLLESKLKFL